MTVFIYFRSQESYEQLLANDGLRWTRFVTFHDANTGEQRSWPILIWRGAVDGYAREVFDAYFPELFSGVGP